MTFFKKLFGLPRKAHPRTLAELCATVPEGGAQWTYYRRFYRIIEGLRPEITEDNGKALFLLADLLEVRFTDGTVLEDHVEFTPGGYDMAEVVAVYFHSISPDPGYWQMTFPRLAEVPHLAGKGRAFLKQIAALPFVESVDSFWANQP